MTGLSGRGEVDVRRRAGPAPRTSHFEKSAGAPCAGAVPLEPQPRTRSDGRMAELVPFAVPIESDKTLLVWELSSGPTAEDLHVSWSRVEGRMEAASQ